ncbi:MAG TPA: sigma-70 family RNA polymerase sigma factor [Cyclobacteriaceae bacterium]|nr:sigma-70 family RNA polymerase sigma factor [Cyclobacteriaceae bacterium]
MPALNPDSWLTSYGDYLFSYCMIRVNHRETAEDLVQETLISAFRSKDSFKGESSEATWLVAILKNKIIDHYRKRDVLKDVQYYLESTEEDFSKNFFDASNGHWLRDAAPADLNIEQGEFEKILLGCVHKMPPKLVPVFIAKFFDEEDSETICKVHNISSSNYWVIIHRAKVLVRACLEKNWFK